MVNTLAVVVLRPDSSLECILEQDQAQIRSLVSFMSKHYNHIFKVRGRGQLFDHTLLTIFLVPTGAG